MFREVTWAWATSPDPARRQLVPLGDNPEFIAQVRQRLEDVTAYPAVQGIIFFRNVAMDSSAFGASSVLPYGPENTYTSGHLPQIAAEPMRYWLNDLPSQRQYPQWWISRNAHFALKGG